MDFTGETISTPPVEEIVEEQPIVEEGQEIEAAPEPQQDDIVEKVKGLETAIGKEREERRILQAKAEYLEQLAFSRASGQTAPEEPDLDPDDFPTNAVVKNMVAKEVGAIKENFRQQSILQQEEQAKAKFTDFEEVVGTFTKELVALNPDMYAVIMNSKNPPKTAYEYGKTHPKYIEKIQKGTAQTIAKKINSNVSQTPTLGSVGGVSNDKMQPGYFSRMPKADFEKYVQEQLNKP